MVTRRPGLSPVVAAFAAAWGLLAWVTGPAGAIEKVDPADAFLELVVEPLADTPYEQEMVLLTVRGFYRANITLANLEQPASGDFGWMQLGKDRWIDTTVGGRQGRRYERTIAVFPRRSGQIEIGAFVHHLTLMTRRGTRFVHRVSTQPTRIEVQAKPASVDWWLPARAVRMTDSWDRAPDQLAFGQTARRTVTLEVAGLGPERLPPVPALRGAGVIAFTDPETRATERTSQGPVSRVVWRWTVKPSADGVGRLEPVAIPWFDTATREHREIVLPGQRVALAVSTAAEPQGTPLAEQLAGGAIYLGLLGGFLFGLILVAPGWRIRSRADLAARMRALLPDPDAWALRRAAWRSDPPGLRRAAFRLLRKSGAARGGDTHGAQGGDTHGAQGGAAGAFLAALDQALFAPAGARRPVDLRKQARGFLAALKSARAAAGR